MSVKYNNTVSFKNISVWLMLIATFCWGSSYLFMKQCLTVFSAFNLIGWRFGIAFILTAICFVFSLKKLTFREFIHGMILGVMLAFAFYLVMLGLPHTTTGNAGFLLGCTCVFVPIISALFTRKMLPVKIIIAALCAAAGVGFITLNNYFIHAGDLFCLGSALAYSFYIILSSYYLKHDNALHLGIIQLGSTALCGFLGASITDTVQFPPNYYFYLPLLFLAIICSAAGFLLQMQAQKHLSPACISIIYSAEPVFAMSTGVIFLGEQLGGYKFFGAFLILSGILITSINFRRSL